MNDREYFIEFLDSLAFIEAKEYANNPLVSALGNKPIPIFQEDILKEVKRQKETDSLNYESLLKGMVTIVSIDESFPYWKDYKNFLKNMGEDVFEYLSVKAFFYLKENSLEWAYIYGKTKFIVTEDIEDLYFPTIVMEQIYNREWQEDNSGNKSEFLLELLKEIQGNYEKIVKENPKHVLAFERLGNIYVAKEQYVKARLYYEKALRGQGLEEDFDRIRENLMKIENYAYLEAADSYMHYNRFEEALEQLKQIKEHTFLPDKINHRMGMSHYGLGQYDLAIHFLQVAYNLNKDNLEIANDLSVAQAATGNLEKAIEILSQIIIKNPQSRTSIYNRGILYYNLGDFQEALMDFRSAYALESDQGLLDLIEKLEESIKK